MELFLQLSVSTCVLGGNVFLIVSLKERAGERLWQPSPALFRSDSPPRPGTHESHSVCRDLGWRNCLTSFVKSWTPLTSSE